MNLSFLGAILAQATSTPSGSSAAPGGPVTEQPNPQGQIWSTVLMFGVMAILVYLFMFRPQSQRAKQQEAMLKAVKPGDKVVTSSGIVGTVVALKDKTLSLRSADTKLEVLKSTVTEITERAGDSSSG